MTSGPKKPNQMPREVPEPVVPIEDDDPYGDDDEDEDDEEDEG